MKSTITISSLHFEWTISNHCVLIAIGSSQFQVQKNMRKNHYHLKKIKILYYQIKKIIILIFKDFNFISCIIKIISFKYLKCIYIFEEKKYNVTRNDTLIYELFLHINPTLLLITCSNKYLLASS